MSKTRTDLRYTSAYQPPSTGLLSLFHPSFHPYLQLMRLDRPKPALYFYLPHLVGTLQAGILLQVSSIDLIRANCWLAVGTFFLRGATCTWNDMVDVDFDRRVERTRLRPLARGAIGMPAALVFMLAQSACAAGVLYFLPPTCLSYAAPGVLGWAVYPLAKRFTDYPQLVLGFPMAWGIFMGATAVGADPLSIGAFDHASSPIMAPAAAQALVCVYIANVFWTLCYETVYSYQDIRDDVAAGVKNIALLLGQHYAKPFLATTAALDLGFLFLAGQLMGATGWYYLFSIVLKGAALATKIALVNLREPEECLWWFRDGGYIVGSVLVAGFVLEYDSSH